jgi:hypothetical protein
MSFRENVKVVNVGGIGLEVTVTTTLEQVLVFVSPRPILSILTTSEYDVATL